MGLLKNITCVWLQRKFLHLYGFTLLDGSIESDNHNGTIEKYYMRLVTKKVFCTCMASYS